MLFGSMIHIIIFTFWEPLISLPKKIWAWFFSFRGTQTIIMCWWCIRYHLSTSADKSRKETWIKYECFQPCSLMIQETLFDHGTNCHNENKIKCGKYECSSTICGHEFVKDGVYMCWIYFCHILSRKTLAIICDL